jgi:hypothetical protein
MLQDGERMSELVERYRFYAAECLRIAQDVPANEKLSLLNMAQSWLALAERAIKNSEVGSLTR